MSYVFSNFVFLSCIFWTFWGKGPRDLAELKPEPQGPQPMDMFWSNIPWFLVAGKLFFDRTWLKLSRIGTHFASPRNFRGRAISILRLASVELCWEKTHQTWWEWYNVILSHCIISISPLYLHYVTGDELLVIYWWYDEYTYIYKYNYDYIPILYPLYPHFIAIIYPFWLMNFRPAMTLHLGHSCWPSTSAPPQSSKLAISQAKNGAATLCCFPFRFMAKMKELK